MLSLQTIFNGFEGRNLFFIFTHLQKFNCHSATRSLFALAELFVLAYLLITELSTVVILL